MKPLYSMMLLVSSSLKMSSIINLTIIDIRVNNITNVPGSEKEEKKLELIASGSTPLGLLSGLVQQFKRCF